MGKPGSKKHTKTGNKREDSLIDGLDDLNQYDEFKKLILPELRKALLSGVSGKALAQQFTPQATARLVTIALTETDAAKATSAIKELIDRAEGKAAQKQETIHKFGSLKEEQLDALIKSRLLGTEAVNEESEDDTH